jgi:hypothetical protein
MTRIITAEEFISIINNIKGCQFASLVYTTDIASMNKKFIGGKKCPYYGRVNTTTEMASVQIGYDYENAVNNRIADESTTFKAESLPWGTWLRPNYLIGHKGATYLRCYLAKPTKVTTTYYLDGELPVDGYTIEDIMSYIRPTHTSARQSEVGIEESEQVKPLTINIANIAYAVIDKVKYIIK